MAILAALASLFITSLARAGTFSGIHPLQSSRFILGAGGYWMDISNSVALEREKASAHRYVDFQDDLGFDDTNLELALRFSWRITERFLLEATYFSVGQNNATTLRKNLEWDDLEFETSTRVEGNFDMSIYRALVGYSFIKDDRKELGAGIGLHYLDIDTWLRGQAQLNDVPLGQVKRGFSAGAVLPNLGIYGNYAFSPKWLLSARVDWIGASVGDYDGTLWNAQASLQYQLFEHMGVGFSYRHLGLDLSEDSNKRYWKVDLDYGGPVLFVTANF